VKRMPSFMMEIDASRRSPLEQLAVDYVHVLSSGQPSLDFCRRALGVPESDLVVAGRLSVAVATVRGWREVARRAGGWSCR
jgi:hypothetical protein